MTGDDRLRAELRSLEEAVPADLPPIPAGTRSPRWRRLALPAAVMVIAGTLIGLSVPNWLPGALPFGTRVGQLVPLPTGPNPAPSGQPVLCQQALMAGTLVRDPVHGFVVANGDHRTPVRWPNGYVGREGGEGLELLNEAGQVVAREGDYVEMGGGQGEEMWVACPGPDVIPPEFTGTLEGDEQLEGGCIWLRPESGRRWPIAWPDGYREEFRGGEPVLLRDGGVVARAGDQVTVRGTPGDMGYACIGFSSYVATEVLAMSSSHPNEPSAAPSAGLTHVAAKSMSFVLPAGWTYRLPDADWGNEKFIFFSNQPMQSNCERTEDEYGVLTRCGPPIEQLVSGGVLVDWWNMSWYWLPSPPPLPQGTPYALGGSEGVRAAEDVAECGKLGATHAELITLPGTSHLRICARDPSDQTLAELEGLLQSIEFWGGDVAIPTQEEPPARRSPLPCAASLISGTLVRDDSHGVVIDTGDQRIPVVWPHGYFAREGPDGILVLDRHGIVMAAEGEEVELGGGMDAADERFVTCNN